MTHDAAHWDERYAAEPAPGPNQVSESGHLAGAPDPALVEAVGDLPPGRALDVATGLGRHARWLAARGWAVTAVDFSTVGIARARALEPEPEIAPNGATARHPRRKAAPLRATDAAQRISWVVADVRDWDPPESAHDQVGHEQSRHEQGPHEQSRPEQSQPDLSGYDLSGYDLVLCAFVRLDLETFARLRTWLAPHGRLVVVTHAPGSDDGPRNPAYRYDQTQLRAAAHGLVVERLTEQRGRLTLVARRPQP